LVDTAGPTLGYVLAKVDDHEFVVNALAMPLFKNYAEPEYKCNFRVAGRSACAWRIAGRFGLPSYHPEVIKYG
jgi:hypothetical protein